MLKVGIIGFGRMGITHYSIINSHPKVKIVGVVDKSLFLLNLLKKYIKGINIYRDYENLFKDEDLDALIICTPPNIHYKIAKMALKSNIHVFMEKPCTLNRNLALELSKLFKEKRLVNQVGYVNRFNDVFIKVREYLDKNYIGEIIRFKSEMYSCTITKSQSNDNWRDFRESGGGATFDMAAHAIDLVNYLIGEPDKITGSSLTKIYSKNVEDAVNATLLYKNGITGILNVNWSDHSYRKPTNKIEILGSNGKILADQHGLKLYKNKSSKIKDFKIGWNNINITDIFQKVPFYVRGNEFTSQLYYFVDSIIKKKNNNKSCFLEASKTLNIVEKIFNDYNLNRIKY